MSQQLFANTTTPDSVKLDANFTELYSRILGGTAAAAYIGSTTYNLDVTGYSQYLLQVGSGGTAKQAGLSYAPGIFLALGIFANDTVTDLTLVTSNGTNRVRVDAAAGHFKPEADNAQTMGSSAKRWSVVYAATGAINTSDAREKTAVTPLSAAELDAAKDLSAAIGSYQWLAAVQAKGADARTHIGLTVQRAMEIMTAHGLDPMAYGFICHDSWEARADSNTEAGDRYGFRVDELLLFMARGFDARLAAAGL